MGGAHREGGRADGPHDARVVLEYYGRNILRSPCSVSSRVCYMEFFALPQNLREHAVLHEGFQARLGGEIPYGWQAGRELLQCHSPWVRHLC